MLTDFNVLCRPCHRSLHDMEHPDGSVYATTLVFLEDRKMGPHRNGFSGPKRRKKRDVLASALSRQNAPSGLTVKKATEVLALLKRASR